MACPKTFSSALIFLGLCSTFPITAQTGSPSRIRSTVAAGESHTLAVMPDGTVRAWGYNEYGQLGDGTTRDRTAPVQVRGLDGVVSVAGGYHHSLALKADGTVWAWGANEYGELGDGTTTWRATPVQVRGLSGIVSIAASDGYSIALKADGTIWIWGDNSMGMWSASRLTPIPVNGVAGAVAIAAGRYHHLALKSDGTVWSWGAMGQPAPVSVNGMAGVLSITAGEGYSLALKQDGTVWTWAFNDPSHQQKIAGLTGAVAVASGFKHAVAVKDDGTVWTWGDNTCGQLGDGTTVARSAPGAVDGIRGISNVATGGGHVLAWKTSGGIWAWGDNRKGQLGTGAAPSQATRVQVSGLTNVKGIAARDHRLALRNDGTLLAWGVNNSGQLGDGTTSERYTPVPVSGLTQVVAAASGVEHSLALQADGTVWAWGCNRYGQLGDGTTTQRLTPVPVSGLAGVKAVAASQSLSVALKADGTVWTWGSLFISHGVHATVTTPQQAKGLAEIVAVAAGYDHALAVGRDGTIWAWGSNDQGQLGDGTNIDHPVPVQVPGLGAFTSVAADGFYSLALKSDGTVWAWGSNVDGYVGDCTTSPFGSALQPVQVCGLSGIVSIASAMGPAALRADGTVWTWGRNSDGALGDGTSVRRASPVQAGGLAEIAAIAGQSLALKKDGTVWTWGRNDYGQLGIGATAKVLRPEAVLFGVADLSIAGAKEGAFIVGGEGAYRLTVSNQGQSATAGTIIVTHQLSPGLSFAGSAGDGWSCAAADRNVNCTNPGPLDPGSTSTLQVTVRVGAAAWPAVTDFATVSYPGDSNPWNNTAATPVAVLPGPVVVNDVVHSASYTSGAIAPGQIVSIFGDGIGWPQGIRGNPNPAQFLECLLGETRVLFDGIEAPLLFVHTGQIVAVVPYSLAGKHSTQLQVEFRGVLSNAKTLAITESAPGLYVVGSNGSGQAAILNQDGTSNSRTTPARRGSVVILYATGVGLTSPAGVDGKVASEPGQKPVLPVSVRMGGEPADVIYAGAAPGMVTGVLQVNVRIPDGIAPGAAVPVTLTAGNAQSQEGVTIAVE